MPSSAAFGRTSSTTVEEVVLSVAFVGTVALFSHHWVRRRGGAQQAAILPPWVFGLVWAVLYCVLAWGLWDASGRCNGRRTLLAVVVVLQGAWCALFFGGGRVCAALGILAPIVVLAGLVAWHTTDDDDTTPRALRVGLVLHAGWCAVALLLNGAACRVASTPTPHLAAARR